MYRVDEQVGYAWCAFWRCAQRVLVNELRVFCLTLALVPGSSEKSVDLVVPGGYLTGCWLIALGCLQAFAMGLVRFAADAFSEW